MEKVAEYKESMILHQNSKLELPEDNMEEKFEIHENAKTEPR